MPIHPAAPLSAAGQTRRPLLIDTAKAITAAAALDASQRAERTGAGDITARFLQRHQARGELMQGEPVLRSLLRNPMRSGRVR